MDRGDLEIKVAKMCGLCLVVVGRQTSISDSG